MSFWGYKIKENNAVFWCVFSSNVLKKIYNYVQTEFEAWLEITMNHL